MNGAVSDGTVALRVLGTAQAPGRRSAIETSRRCYIVGTASTIQSVGRDAKGSAEQNELYTRAVAEFGRMLERLPRGYEADPEKRRDLSQEIHFQLWRSLGSFDGRCSLKTWTLRVAHNTAASYVIRERRNNAKLISFEDIERIPEDPALPRDMDWEKALGDLYRLIFQLKPLDRQIIISYIEEMDAASIAEITGLTPANITMKIHRIKKILGRQFREEKSHA